MRGRGPKPGAPNAGRPPDAWKAKMAALRDRWLIAAELEQVVDTPDHPDWFKVGKFLHEAVAGRPASTLDVTSDHKPLSGVVILPPTT